MTPAEHHTADTVETFYLASRHVQSLDVGTWGSGHPFEQVTLHRVDVENNLGTLVIFFGGQHAGTEPMGVVAAYDSVMLAANTLERGAMVVMPVVNRSGWLLGQRDMTIHTFNRMDSNRSTGDHSTGEVAEYMNGIVDVIGTLALVNRNELLKHNMQNAPCVAVDWHAEGDYKVGVPEEASMPYVRLVDIGDDELLAKTIELALTTGLPTVFDYRSDDVENKDLNDATLDAALMKNKKIPTVVIELGSGVVSERYRQIARAVSANLWNHYGMISRATKKMLGVDRVIHQLPKIPRDQPLRLRDSYGIDPKGNRICGGDTILLKSKPGDFVTKGRQVATRINLLRIQEDQQPIFADQSGWVLSTVGPYTVNYADPERELMLVASPETDQRVRKIWSDAYRRFRLKQQ